MNCPSPKRQNHGNKQASLEGTQSQSSIFSHNRRVYLEFLKQFNALKHKSVHTDLDINTERHHLISILGKLEQAPIGLPCVNSILKPSYACSYSLGQSGKNYSSNNIIDLDPDEVSAGTWTHSDVGNIGIDAKLLVNSDKEDGIKSFESENSSSKNSDVHQCLLPKLPVNHQDIILLDNCNSSTEPQILSQQGSRSSSMDIDNASDEDHHEVIGKTGRAPEKDGIDLCEISCDPQINENYHDKSRSVDELEDFWRDMSVALACSKTIGTGQSSCEEMENTSTCNHDFLMKDDVGIMCRFCGLIQQNTDKIFEYSWKKYRRRRQKNKSG